MKPHPDQMLLPVLAELIPQGDGSYKLKPRIPDTSGDTWLTAAQAHQMMGPIHRRTLYRLLETGAIVSRHIGTTPHSARKGKVQVSLRSLESYLKSTIHHPAQ